MRIMTMTRLELLKDVELFAVNDERTYNAMIEVSESAMFQAWEDDSSKQAILMRPVAWLALGRYQSNIEPFQWPPTDDECYTLATELVEYVSQ